MSVIVGKKRRQVEMRGWISYLLFAVVFVSDDDDDVDYNGERVIWVNFSLTLVCEEDEEVESFFYYFL